MTRSSWLWPSIIISSATSAGWLTYAAIESPIRPVIVFWFLLICPGMALMRWLRIQDTVAELMLAVALSLALDMLIAVMMV